MDTLPTVHRRRGKGGGMKQEFYDKIMQAAKGVKRGDPLKDFLDHYEVAKAIELLAKLLKESNKEDTP
jgi:hypothetical protein